MPCRGRGGIWWPDEPLRAGVDVDSGVAVSKDSGGRFLRMKIVFSALFYWVKMCFQLDFGGVFLYTIDVGGVRLENADFPSSGMRLKVSTSGR